jgi:serine protease
VCGSGLACVAGACGCPQGLTKCGSACVDIARDVRHCGACGVSCVAGQACEDSRCVSTIPPGEFAGTLNPALPADSVAPRTGATGSGRVSPNPPSAVVRALAKGLRTTPRTEYVAGALSVKLASPAETPAAVLKLLSLAGQRLRFKRSVSPYWHSVVVVDPEGRPAGDVGVERAAGILRGMPAVRHVERVGVARPLAVPTDPYASSQWHYGRAGLPGAWDVTTGRIAVTVAIIDDGITRHPDFGNRVLPGFDFVSDPRNAGDGDGQDPDPTRPAVFPDGKVSFHGTHVAGTIGAETNNGVGVAGVDWLARLVPARALGLQGGSTDDIAAAMRWSAGLSVPGVPTNPNPAKVLNMSLGGPGLSQAFQDAIDEINAAGGIVVVAAGNENMPASQSTPAGQSGVITVGAVGKDALRSSYSNFGSAVDIMAPGGDFEDVDRDGVQDGILSLFADSLGRPSYEYLQGTSMASPHVAGIVALMAAVDPTLDSARAESILRSTAWGQFKCAEGCGAGLVNAEAAVLMAKGIAQAIGPRLLATPLALELGARVTEIVKIRNVGAVDLHFVAEPRGTYAGRTGLARTTGTVPPSQAVDLQLRIDRAGLANGIYPVTIVVRSDGGDTEIPVSFRVGPRPVPTLAVHAIEFSGTAVRSVASVSATEAGSWRWSMNIPPGEYYLVAGSDDDNDGNLGEEGEYYGAWPIASDPRPIRIYSQQRISSLDFATGRRDVVPAPGPGQFEETCTENGDCASLNCLGLSETSGQCTVACGPGTPCPGGYWCGEVFNTGTGAGSEACLPKSVLGDTCGSDEQCLSGRCLASEVPVCVQGCVLDTDCGPGQGCRRRTDLNSRTLDVCVDLRKIGDACTLDGECGNPGGAVCATGWPSGYCISDCSGTPCQSGSRCVGFDNDGNEEVDASYCLSSCATNADCRPGYGCVTLGDGSKVCYGAGGAACTDVSSCFASEFCDTRQNRCRTVSSLPIRLSAFSAIVAPSPSGGGSWDGLGGAPDPFFRVYKNSQLVATSGTASDTYAPSWTSTVNMVVSGSDYIAIVVEDADLLSSDAISTFYVVDLVQALRDGYFAYVSNGNLRRFFFSIALQ